MALTKISRSLLDTGISDSSDATALTIDSSENVGIGTASPARELHVSKASSGATSTSNSVLVVEDDDNTEISILGGSSSVLAINFGHSGDANDAIIAYNTTSSSENMSFTVNAAERMRIDDNGNVGIRKTNLAATLDLGVNRSTAYSSTGEPTEDIIIHNTNGSDGSGVNNHSTLGFQVASGGTSQGFINYVRTADNQGNFTFSQRTGSSSYAEAMRIDSSGNVQVGASSVANCLIGNNGNLINIKSKKDGTDAIPLTFMTQASGGALAERMRITGSGDVLVGGTSLGAASSFGIEDDGHFRAVLASGTAGDSLIGAISGVSNGFQVNTDASNNQTYKFHNGGTPTMTIDSSGKILAGKTTSSITANQGFELTDAGLNMYSTQTSGSASSTYHVLYGSTYKFYVGYNGTVYATNDDITGLSDERLKENVKDLDTGLTEIMALKPRRFDWKEGEGNNTKNNAGFIAQEVETVFPELVDNCLHDELDDAKSLRKGGILPTLVKAVQEQQVIIDDLKARITTLEG